MTITDKVEIYVNSAWTDITGYVYMRDGIEIARGGADESGQPEPARMRLTLDNRDGRWSPRNPSGTYYGQIGRNTPIRCSVEEGQNRLRLTGGDQYYCADSAGVSITGDIDLRIDAVMDWRPSANQVLGILKVGSYQLEILTSGKLRILWLSATVAYAADSTEPIPGPLTGRKSVRATLDVNNGSGGRTMTFYYSDDDTMDGTWVQFGSAVTVSGTTSIDDTANTLGAYSALPMEINEIRVYEGIGGTKRASPKFTSQSTNPATFADAEGNTWTRSSTTALDNRHYRFWGDVTTWPVRWDRAGVDIYSQIECSGMTRRIGQGNTPVKSPLRRGIANLGSDLVAYWPLEDGPSAISAEPVTADTLVGQFIGAIKPASYSEFIASDAIPTIHTGQIYLTVPHYTNTDEFQVRFIFRIRSTTIPDQTVLMRIYTNSSLGWIDWVYATGDLVKIVTYTNYGASSLATTYMDITEQAVNQGAKISLEFNKNGTGVDTKTVALPIGDTVGIYWPETNASITLGSCTQIIVNPDGIDLGDTAIGHISVEKNITTAFDSAHATERAYQGETAAARLSRLCTENGITLTIMGQDSAGSEYLGYQDRSNLLDLLHEAAEADGGILTESRNSSALIYRTQDSIYNQQARGTINYAAENMQFFEPIDDDQRTRNKVTVQRTAGQKATIEDVDTPLSTAAPPEGVGVYDESKTVSLYSDGQAVHHAGWLVRLGTVNEERWPRIGINLAHPDYTGDAALTRQILTIDCGDRLTVTNPPTWIPPEMINQVVRGYTEKITQFEHQIVFNCTPFKPYRAAMFDGHPSSGLGRYWNWSTVTAGSLNTTQTDVDITIYDGPLWTHADGDYDIRIGGERMTVTAVTGSSSPQTLTVTRSVNGVVASHSADYVVHLFDKAYYALGASAGNGLNTGIDEGQLVRAMDFSLPDVVTAYGNGTNTITSTTYAVLPSFPCQTQIINPHPTAPMLCLVYYGAWLSATTNDVRVSCRVNRAGQSSIAAGIGNGGSVGWGEIVASLLDVLGSQVASFTCELSASVFPYVFTLYAARGAAAGTQDVRYATLRVIPLRYVDI